MKQLFKTPAYVTTILWACAWSQFLITEAVQWWRQVRGAPLWAGLAVLLLVLAIVPLRWKAENGVFLLACGLGLLLAYDVWPPRQMKVGLQVMLELLLVLPPLSAGLYFLSRHAESA